MQSTLPEKPTSLIPLVDSHRPPLPCAHTKQAVDPLERATVTIVFRARCGMPMSAYADLGAWARAQQLEVAGMDFKARTVRLTGTLDALQTAFATELTQCRTSEGKEFRSREGMVSVPGSLHPYVLAVLGLSTRPIAKPYIRRPLTDQPEALPASEVARSYHVTNKYDGTGETIALIELGGGYVQSDIDMYFGKFGGKKPTVFAVPVGGAQNAPDGDGADDEVALDIQVAGSVAPGAKIAVYFAVNTDQEFLDAINKAIYDSGTSVISISWGGPESDWTPQAMKAFDAAFAEAQRLGIPVLAAAGDNGGSDGATGKNVDFPASSPSVIGCGGTRLVLKPDGSVQMQSEWNDGVQGGGGGGGLSKVFPRPSYQEASLPARGVPDIAANADPDTGYPIVVGAQWQVVGGTSAVAPLMAGFVCLWRQAMREKWPATPFPPLLPLLYKAPNTCFWDVRQGNNNYDGQGGYSAGPGYDLCTGLGTPLGNAMLAFLEKEVGQ
jgi:kumamolisin